MADIFTLPAIGDAMVEGEVVEWFVAVGDVVDLDQRICAIETDKSVVELTTPYRGTVLSLGGSPGDVLDVGAPLLIVGTADEVAAAAVLPESIGTAPIEVQQASQPNVVSPVLSPVLRKLAEELHVDLSMVAGTGHGDRITRTDVEMAAGQTSESLAPAPAPAVVVNGPVRAMPKVRKAAREASIDLRGRQGSGPDGVVTLSDLEPGNNGGGERRERLSAMRRSIARHLTESAQTIPQFTSTIDIDATAIIATRAALRERLDRPIPIDAVIMALLIPVLRDHPVINARLDDVTDEVVYFDRFNLGIAIDTPDGLMVPVVTDADRRDVAGTAAEIVRLATAARGRTVQPHELSGATCTLNNVGAVGIESGTPILPIGTSTIIAIGASRPSVQLHDGNPVAVPIMTVCATFDHRIIDGGDAGRFLTQLKQHLEVPALGLL